MWEPRFALKHSGLELERHSRAGAFFDVVGRRAAVFGYENRTLEAWVYPLKILDDFKLSFALEGYPLDLDGSEINTWINVRPEATTFTYSHAAFTARQIIFAPVDEPGIVMLIDVATTLPLRVTASFRPRLRLMWPAGLMTGNVGWDEETHVYSVTEETNRFAAIVGSPSARDLSVMPYQEEPRDAPIRFVIEVSPDAANTQLIPIVLAGSVDGRTEAMARYTKLLGSIRELYESNVAYYKTYLEGTTRIVTPDGQLNTAFSWAKIGVDKGMASNPQLGTGLLAGFRTSGDSERPGFAWFFGRDALWTALAITSYGDFTGTRTALAFLKKFQRADGKIPHEISQSASYIPWFTDYPYPWASADATPLYIIAHADYWRASGDRDFLTSQWASIVSAYRFSAATDSDGNALIENTSVGHGWVEGGALYPPHEEIYMQGLWIQAARDVAELAGVMNDQQLAVEARARAETTRVATERTYWLADREFYAFGTSLPRPTPTLAEPGPRRSVRQARLNALARARLIDEDTVLPAVPLWFRTLEDTRAQAEIDRLGSGALATDWGTRLLSATSELYNPLSYHYGSVWPLFSGWASMGAYAYGRPHVGYQALMANALLTYAGALGYVTELLSGDFNTPFGRSSHHQVWSEAMVVTPLVRGMLGIQITAGGRSLRFAPQLPAHWKQVAVQNLVSGSGRYDVALERSGGRMTITVDARSSEHSNAGQLPGGPLKLLIAPSFPLDAGIRSVSVNGRGTPFQIERVGDVQRAEVVVDNPPAKTTLVFAYSEGSDVYADVEAPGPGAQSEGLRILRSRADGNNLLLTLEGRSGRTYRVRAQSPHRVGETPGVTVKREAGGDPELLVTFEGPGDDYFRKELKIPLLAR